VIWMTHLRRSSCAGSSHYAGRHASPTAGARG
jgi:hypothetical protein